MTPVLRNTSSSRGEDKAPKGLGPIIKFIGSESSGLSSSDPNLPDSRVWVYPGTRVPVHHSNAARFSQFVSSVDPFKLLRAKRFWEQGLVLRPGINFKILGLRRSERRKNR
eukprot:2379075-Rhodomonas_salina.1